MKLKKCEQFSLIITFLNVITPVFGQRLDHIWHSYEFGSGYGNRQELVIKNLTTDSDFKLGEGVIKWKTINLHKKTFAVGMTKSGIAVLTVEHNDATAKFETKHKVNEIDKAPADVQLYKEFALSDDRVEIVLIVASNEKKPSVEWYRIKDDLGLEKIWGLDFHFKIVHSNYMFVDDKHLLVLIHDKYQNSTVVEISFFDLKNKHISFLQLLRLSVTTDSTTFARFGVKNYLAIPQKLKNSVLLYEYKNGRFASFKNVTGVTSDQIVSFKGGYGNYLAVNGNNSEIYELTNFKLRGAQLSMPMKDVDHWIATPAGPFADHSILFAQRLLNHDSHQSYTIDVVLYNNGKFSYHEEMVCSYFGEVANGAECIVNDDHSLGLKGSAVIGDGDHVGLLVPRKTGPSLLVHINYKIRDVPDPVDVEIEKLEITKELIEQAIARKMGTDSRQESMDLKKNETVGDVPDMVHRGNGRYTWLEPQMDFQQVDKLLEEINGDVNALREKMEEVRKGPQSSTNVEAIVVNGNLKVRGTSFVTNLNTNTINGESLQQVLDDTVSLSNLKPITSEKQFAGAVKINHLNVETVNGINFSDFAKKSNGTLRISGSLSFAKSVIVGDFALESGLVNDVNIGEEIVKDDAKIDDLHFESVEVLNDIIVEQINGVKLNLNDELHISPRVKSDSFHTDGDIFAQNVNGQPLEEFLNSVVYTNEPFYIPNQIFLNGTATAGKAYVTFLNGLLFDSGYLFKTSDTFTKITGMKTFTNSVVADEVATNGLLNSADLNKVITLTSNQTLPGNYRFHNLEITESLEIEGSITGSHASGSEPISTLHQSASIKSDVNFKSLEVDGTVTISRNFNGKPFEDLLENVVYKDVDGQVIEAVKEFPNGLTVRENLHLESGAINAIPLELFVTKDTDQMLNMSVLNGSVSIANLQLDGYLDGVSVTQLDQESVKTSGEQYISANLQFNNNELEVQDLSVMNQLNDVKVVDMNRYEDVALNFENLRAENVEILGNLVADLSNFEPKAYEARRLSKSKNQTVLAPFYVGNCAIGTIDAVKMNERDYEELFGVDYLSGLVYEKISAGEIVIEDLSIDGNLYVESINNVNVINLWKQCSNDISMRDLNFNDDLYFDNLTIKKLNGIDFADFASNVVYKNETNLTLNYKKYLNGFKAVDVYADHLNSVPKYDILTKFSKQFIEGPLLINGDVLIADQVNVVETLNNAPMDYLSQSFQVTDNGYRIIDDVMFERLVYADDFRISGLVNEKNLTGILENLISVHDDMIVPQDITFKGPVIVEENLWIKNELNGIDFNKLMDEIVLVDKLEYIEGLVEFTGFVNVTDYLEIDRNFQARFVMGIDLEAWKENAVFVNKGIIPGIVAFEHVLTNGPIETERLNNLSVDSFIPLGTDQNITGKIFIENLSSLQSIDVKNLVNGYNLRKEFENTLLNAPNQMVTSPVTFNGNVLVRDFLTVNNYVNDQDINKVVTTHTDQNLTASYKFVKKIQFEKDLNVDGLVNDINISDWNKKCLKHDRKTPLVVDHVWTVDNNVSFNGNVYGNSMIGNLNVTDLAIVVAEKKSFKTNAEQSLISNYKLMCKDIDHFLKLAKKQIYAYKYLEEFQQLPFETDVENVHSFQFMQNHFMLVSEVNSCNSTLVVWAGSSYEPLKRFETGSIQESVTVVHDNAVFLVTRSNPQVDQCEISGTNLWKINDKFNLELYYKLDDSLLLQESVKPGVFYATSNEHVLEYHLDAKRDVLLKYRKWILHEDVKNMTFIPNGLTTGPVLRNGEKTIKLNLVPEEEDNYDPDATLLGLIEMENNRFLPGRYNGEVLVINVGLRGSRRSLVGIVNYDDVNDFIMIYEDVAGGKLFAKISANNPSSLITLEFDQNGETLLLFLEDNKTLQVYEYKGLEGFKHKSSAPLKGSRLFKTKVPVDSHLITLVGVIDAHKIGLLEVVMDGRKVSTNLDLNCTL